MTTTIPWRLVLASVLVVTVATQPAFITAATIGQTGAELGYDAGLLGLMTAAYFLSAAISSRLIGGRVVERIGWRRSMLTNAAGAGVVLAAIAAFADSTGDLFVGLVAAALLYGLANPAANLALAEQSDGRRLGLIYGLKHAGIPSSTLLAGLAVPTIALTVGWRWVYASAALLALLLVALIPRPGVPVPTTRPAPVPLAMGTGWLTLLSLGSAFATVAAMALGTFHVDAALVAGFDAATAGLILSAGSAASIAARITYGWLADHRRSDGLSWVGVAALVGSGAFVLLAVVPRSLFLPVTLVAFATGWGWPGLMTFGVVRANAGRPAGSTAITQAGVFLGAGLGPAGLGWIIENLSYRAAWLTTAACLVVASGIVWTVRARAPAGQIS